MTDIVSYLNDQLVALSNGFIASLPQLCAAALVLVFTWFGSKIVAALLVRLGRRAGMRSNLVEVLNMVSSIGIWFFGLLIALTIVFPSITPAKALTTLGLGSVAIGFAFKDTFENFLAGLLLLIREPFRLDDYIVCNGIEGTVEQITVRDSHIRRADGQLVVVPNHILFQNPVMVSTGTRLRRVTLTCGIGYGEDLDQARETIIKALRSVESVEDTAKEVQVYAQEFGASSIDFEVTWWTGANLRESRDQVITAVKKALDAAGIEMPFTYQTMTFAEPLRVLTEAEDQTKEPARA